MQTKPNLTPLTDLLAKQAALAAANHIGKAKIRPTSYFLPTQAKWVFDNSPRKFCVKGRQCGWSKFTMFRHALNLGYGPRHIDTWVTSTDQTQASLLVEDVIWCADILQLGGFGDRLIKSVTQDCVNFSNGNRLHSLSSNPNAQAGKRGNRVLDELALHEQQEKLLAIAMPGNDWSGDVEIFSTPRGTDTQFHRLMMDIEHNGNPRQFSYYKYTLKDFLDEGGLYKIQCALPHNHHVQEMNEDEYFDYKRREAINEEMFNQEYMCISYDEASAFLSYDLITAAEYPPGTEWQDVSNPTDPELYIGIDVGRDRDLTVMHVLEKVGSTYYTRYIQVLEKASFDEQEKCLYEWLQSPFVKRCCIDQTGIGRQFTERAQQKFGKYKVEGITFTQAMKEDLAFPVRMAFEDRTIRIPNDKLLRSDLRAIRKEHTSSGNIRFAADRGENGHADRFWALALALHATKPKNQPLEITIGY